MSRNSRLTRKQARPRILYLSYDGISDQLGQSQILPYLAGLSEWYEICLITCEKKTTLSKMKTYIRELVDDAGVEWHPLIYHKSPPVLSTLFDLYRITNKCLEVHQKNPVSLVHCRSHLLAVVGLHLKKQCSLPFLFDMRSFYPEERVDGKLWPQSKLLYRIIFRYFKNREKRILSSCDHTIVLTEAAKKIVAPKTTGGCSVIPCCADFLHFDGNRICKDDIDRAREKIKIPKDSFVVTYLGSLGTWYCLDDMLEFFSVLKETIPNAVFLFITNTSHGIITEKLVRHGIDKSDVRVCSLRRDEIPSYLLLSSVSIFFIMNTYSKIASSPTKHAELMAMGIPVISNYGVGDISTIISKSKTGTLVRLGDRNSYRKAIDDIGQLVRLDPLYIRGKGEEVYSLSKGVERYRHVYSSILGGES